MSPKQTKPKAGPGQDPFFGLKYIAYCRSSLPVNEEDVDDEAMIQFARWQICKVRGVLWGDPIWDNYTPEEILVEYFAIKYDENEQLRNEFEAQLVSAKKSDLDWLERMEQKDREAKQGKIKEGVTEEKPKETPAVEFTPQPPGEFEDKF
jgi:hypothetical protein